MIDLTIGYGYGDGYGYGYGYGNGYGYGYGYGNGDGDGNGYGDGDGNGDGDIFEKREREDMGMDTFLAIIVGTYGWVTAGEVWDDGVRAGFSRGVVIERWGTKEGLGQIQHDGPEEDTVLRKEGPVDWSVVGGEVRRLHIVDEESAKSWRAAIDEAWGKIG